MGSLLASLSVRSMRTRAVACLLLFAQATSLLVVPLHAIAHAGTVTHRSAVADASPDASSALSMTRLLGHDRGVACDDWNAAFALDANPGTPLPSLKAFVPAVCTIAGRAAANPLAAPPRPFLARAPPRA